MGQMMPPQAPMSMRQRMSRGVRRVQDIFPKWLSTYPIVVYILALMVVSFMYSSFEMPWYYILFGVVSVLAFFLFGSTAVRNTSLSKIHRERVFERKLFLLAIIPRIIFTLLLYWIFMSNYGDEFGIEAGDATFYNDLGKEFADALKDGKFFSYWSQVSQSVDVSDMGYGAYVGLVYSFSNNSIIVVRLIKCLLSAFTVLLVYRIARRNFDTPTARLAAIFCALWPNFWYYCAVHLKETEMVFLGVLFVEQADQMIRSRQFTAWKVIPVLLIPAALLTIRTPLAVVAVLALLFTIVMSSSKVVNWGKRIIVGALAAVLVVVTMGNRIEEQSRSMFEEVQGGRQKINMEWRAERKDKGGYQQAFAKYAGASIFAPMIFTLPFPTFAYLEGQEVQQLLNGGNFAKNIISGFTIFALVMLLLSGKWRDHLLPLSFMLGYLVVLTMSAFAQSERFHQPVMPFEFMFAAYGLSIAVTKPKYKRWFMYWCALMFIGAVAWNWFKLAGRGLA